MIPHIGNPSILKDDKWNRQWQENMKRAQEQCREGQSRKEMEKEFGVDNAHTAMMMEGKMKVY